MEKNKVLIVDDIPENIETISEMIKDFDIDVKTANGGQEAIELIDTFKPDVILLDLMMPHVNGWDVISCCPTPPFPKPTSWPRKCSRKPSPC